MPLEQKVTLRTLRSKAAEGQKIVWLSLYDFPSAAAAEDACADGVIVGDSVMQAVYGQPNTLKADMDLMIRHTQAVRQGGPNLFVVADMPYMSYQPSVEIAVRNAGRFMADAGADAVKFEGGVAVLDKIQAAVKAGIPVVGHLGFTPQSAALTGGVIVETRDAHKAARLIEEAIVLEQTGVVLLVLEAIPHAVAAEVVKRVSLPTIGIGSGGACAGQVMLASDILGVSRGKPPKFVEKFADLGDQTVDAFSQYAKKVRSGQYPAQQHCYKMTDAESEAFAKLLTEIDKP